MEIDKKMIGLCRVCLTSNHNNQCIFRKNCDDSNNANISELSEKLQLCGGIQVFKDDGLPTSICTECITKVNIAYELREQCQNADMKLRELYGKSLTRIATDNCIFTKVITIS